MWTSEIAKTIFSPDHQLSQSTQLKNRIIRINKYDKYDKGF